MNNRCMKKIKSVFDDFFNVELNSSRFSDREMMAKKSQGMPFSFNDMSDGERAAFFLYFYSNDSA